MATAAPAPAARAVHPPPVRRTPRAGIFGLGAALPDRVVTNDDLSLRLDTNDAWIVRRTGIRERRNLTDGEALADLAAAACAEALADAGREASEVDRLIVSTMTPDRLMPGLAPMIAGRLGCPVTTGAVDLNAACSGFLFALDEAAALVESGRARVVLVCGAEAMSRVLDHDDRSTAVLFGDGAGAVVVSATDGPSAFGPVVLGSDPTGGDLIRLARDELRIRMDGPEVYKRAVSVMTRVTREALGELALEDVDLFVYHQAHARILRAVGQRLGLDAGRVVDYVSRYANTSAASLPIALATAVAEGRLRPGDRVLLAAFGAGLVWGGVVVEWG
jgi:3-oxoacyl-[acyl-carrier-protein] synthase-3